MGPIADVAEASRHDREVGRYISECASFCPHCEATEGIRRLIGVGETTFVRSSDERPQFVIECYCAFCGGEWIERYRLETADWAEA